MKSVEKRTLAVLNKSAEYYKMMRVWHGKKPDGAALESEVRDILLRNARGAVLDAGCGEGALVRWMLKHTHPKEVVGVDASKLGVDMARNAVRDNRVRFQQVNLKHLPFKDDCFDFVVCHSVLEHVVDYPEALKEFFRVLEPGGHLLIRLGNEHGQPKLLFLLNCLLHLNKSKHVNPSLKLRKSSDHDHMHNFDVNVIPSDALLKDVKLAGFKVRYFSTGFKSYVNNPEFKQNSWLVRAAIWGLAKFAFFPFNHLGGLIIILGEKP